MARTKKAEIARRYREQEARAKEAYKAEKGLKIARGFKATRTARNIKRNKGRALNRYEEKKLTTRIEKDIFSLSSNKITKFDNIVDQEFYFTELYAPPGQGDSFIINQFKLAESGQTAKPVRAIIQDEDGSTTVYKTMFEFDKAINRLYKDLNDRQRNEWQAANKIFRKDPNNKGKSLAKSEFIRLVSISSGETDKYEILTLKIDKP